MRDSRLELFTSQPVTISSNTTTNGKTIDLLDNYVGDYSEGAEVAYGIGVEILVYDITGTRIDLQLKWQVSDDGSSWVDDQEIYPDTNIMTASANGTKLAISTRLRTPRRYARVVAVTTDNNAGSFKMRGWASDGTTKHGYSTQVRV